MKVKRFLNYICFRGQKPDSISYLRWRGMEKWYKKRKEQNDWFESELN